MHVVVKHQSPKAAKLPLRARLVRQTGFLLASACVMLGAACGISLFEDRGDELASPPTSSKRNRGNVADTASAKETSTSARSESSSSPTSATALADNKTDGDPARAGQAWLLDGGKSRVELVVLKATGEHRVRFPSVEGQLTVLGGVPQAVQVEVTLDKASADSGAFARHLLSPDFLDAKKYSTARFSSTRVTIVAQPAHKVKVEGALTLHGITRGVAFEAELTTAKQPVSTRGKAVLRVAPQDFQIPTTLMGEEMVEAIELHLDLDFAKPAI